MSLRLVDRLPPGGGRFARYEGHDTQPGWEPVDLAPIIARRRSEWLEELDAWHHEVSASASRSPAWWLSPGSRLAAWYPVDLKPLFFVLASLEAADATPGTLHLVGCPPAASALAREWGAAGAAPAPPRAPTGGAPLRGVIAQARRGLRGRARRPERARVVVFSLALDARILATEDDHYFGGMLDALGDDVAWIYYPDRIHDLGRLRALLRSTGRRIRFYFEWLGPREILLLLRDAARAERALAAIARGLPALRIAGRSSSGFAVAFGREVVTAALPVSEIATLHALRRAFAELRPESVLYPYEEKGFERAVLLAKDAAAPSARAVAFAHAVYNDGHVYARTRRLPQPPRADVLAVTGEAAREWFVGTAGMSPERVVVMGSPRFRPARPLPPSPHRRARLRVLFVVGYGHEPGVLASYAAARPALFDGCEIMVRRYPYAWPRQDDGIARLRSLAPRLVVDGGALDDQIAWSDVVLFDSTSAGVHAMVRGRAAVSVALPDPFTADLARGKGDLPGLIRCGDGHALAAALARLREMDDESYLELERAQMRSAARIYGPTDAARLRTLLLPGGGSERSSPVS